MTRPSRSSRPPTDADLAVAEVLAGSDKCFVVDSGAGSGKTTSLVRALTTIRELHGARLDAANQRVACITYTVNAANEILAEVGNEPWVHVSTIHGFLWQLMKPFQSDIATWVAEEIDRKVLKLEGDRLKFTNRHKQKTIDQNARDVEKYKAARGTMKDVKAWRYDAGRNFARGVVGHSDVLKMVPDLLLARPTFRAIARGVFPFILVDESQDSAPTVVEALLLMAAESEGETCLGFFGDPMQRIYPQGVGPIEPSFEVPKFTKVQNYRNPARVLALVNAIRKPVDGLVQLAANENESAEGAVTVLGLPELVDAPKQLAELRKYLARTRGDTGWLSDDGTRVLVLIHRQAAQQMGFLTLFDSAQAGGDRLKRDFVDGVSWALEPFITIAAPIAQAMQSGDSGLAFELMRSNVVIDLEALSLEDFQKWPTAAAEISRMLASGSQATLRALALVMRDVKLGSFDVRLRANLGESDDLTGAPLSITDEDDSLANLLDSPASELWAYLNYVEKVSPYSTQQAIKGSEFPRVLMVIDWDAKPFFGLDYKSFFESFGLASVADPREAYGNSGPALTRRLFYVCCSRATQDLVVAVFAGDCEGALDAIGRSGFFKDADLEIVDELTP